MYSKIKEKGENKNVKKGENKKINGKLKNKKE